MTNKQKHNFIMKLNKFKQAIIIFLMIVSGLWYVTKGREKSSPAINTVTVNASSKTFDTGNDAASSQTQQYGKSIFQEQDNTPDEPIQSEQSLATTTTDTGSSSLQSDTPSLSGTETHDNSSISSESFSASGIAPIPEETSPETKTQNSSLVNLNTATPEELDSLPGVGPSTAQNIIKYREEYGGFADIEEIKNVKRIGDKTFAKLKDHITV